MNTVELQGRIHNIYEGRFITIVTLIVNGTTNKGETVNFPQVKFTGQSREDVKNFKIGDYVNISGTMKVRSVTQKNGHNYFDQFIKGQMIYAAQTDMSDKFNQSLGGQYNNINEVLIKGEIKSTNTDHGLISVMIVPDDEKFRLWMTTYIHDKDSFLKKYIPGTRVCVKAEIQTTRREKNGEVRFFENLIIKYLDIDNEPVANTVK